uniref:Uncharacterized protein n=1 Tax=Chromera velia CCMP2878 TaxID=1169474 RepID=A0A0G4G1E0_9ALVE|eukprot:Cvel_4017.t1-p1 / transcript=Cvel_4017.t1 / gene=Cvel_4017 / organism=Chromera_velia_CCMP2878 / gene_product=hypothetical protein / transcript_product=hypothetical protein / location=Cvel_scaffold171:12191-14815(+) / protein_length=312 / sequence_SO=supercontig / SO=protein_coding / is_pseudo=false
MGARRRCSSREGVSVTREGAETGGWARTRTHVGREVEQVGSVCCENLGIGSTRLHERLCVSAEAFSVLSVRDCSMTSICADELTSRDVVLKADSRRKQPPPDCRNANGTGVAVLEVAVLAEGCSEGARRIGEESSLQDLCRVSSSVWVGVVAVMRAWRRSSRTRTAATLCEEARHAGRVLRSALPQAKRKLAEGNPPFPFDDLPTDRNDNIWNQIRADYNLTLPELSALTNERCSGQRTHQPHSSGAPGGLLPLGFSLLLGLPWLPWLSPPSTRNSTSTPTNMSGPESHHQPQLWRASRSMDGSRPEAASRG